MVRSSSGQLQKLEKVASKARLPQSEALNDRKLAFKRGDHDDHTQIISSVKPPVGPGQLRRNVSVKRIEISTAQQPIIYSSNRSNTDSYTRKHDSVTSKGKKSNSPIIPPLNLHLSKTDSHTRSFKSEIMESLKSKIIESKSGEKSKELKDYRDTSGINSKFDHLES